MGNFSILSFLQMNIKAITIKNFRSIQEIENLDFKTFNVLVGQNNHGKKIFLIP